MRSTRSMHFFYRAVSVAGLVTILALAVWLTSRSAQAWQTTSRFAYHRPLAGGVHHFPVRRLLPPNATAYAGAVTTLSGPFNIESAVTYDSVHKIFYVGSLGQIDSVTLTGTTTLVASFSPTVGGLVYDSTTKLIYATDPAGSAVWTISLTGVTTLLAGGTHGTNDGLGTSAQFQGPTGIAFDAAHQLFYIVDVDRIRTMTTSGNVVTLTPPGSIGLFGGSVGYPLPVVGLTFDALHSVLYVADNTQNTIDTVTPSGNVSIFAGRCISFVGFGCDQLQVDGPRLQAGFAQPTGVIVSPIDHSLYISEAGNNDVRRLSTTGAVTTLAGSGIPGNTDALAILASFQNPGGLAIDPSSGLLMVADTGNQKIRSVTTVGSIPPPPLHGTLTYDPPTQDSAPSSIAVTKDGTVWFTEQNSGLIGRRAPTGVMTEYLLPAGRANPANMVVGPDGAVWFTDASIASNTGHAAVGRISATGAIVEYPITNHNPYSSPVLAGLTVGSDKNLWFTDPQNNGLGFVTSLGHVTEYATINLGPIVLGFDGNLWATGGNTATPSIWRYATTGRLLNAYSPSEGAFNVGSGPDSAMWFAANAIPQQQIGRLTINGNVKYFIESAPSSCPFFYFSHFMTGPNHYIWLLTSTNGCGAFVSELNTIGGLTNFPIYVARSAPNGLAFAPDGSAWFADPGSNKIGKLY